MKEAPSLKFKAYTLKELGFRISKALQEKRLTLSFWKECSPLESQDLAPYKFEQEDDSLRVYLKEKLEVEEADSKILFYFSLDKTHYFGLVKSVDFCEQEQSIVVEISGDIHALEGREQERLLAVPHHQIYAYVKIPVENEEMTNVIALNKVRKQKQDLQAYQDKHLGVGQELMGFRVVDISKTGLSFVANEEEFSYFEKNDQEPVALTLMFNGRSFFIQNAKYVYGTSYVNPKARKLPMYKIGLSFYAEEELEKLIDESIDRYSRDPFECHVYENFILGRDEVFKV